MRWGRATAGTALVGILTAACSDGATLYVDVVSDLDPCRSAGDTACETDEACVELLTGDGGRRCVSDVSGLLEGTRVAELTGLENGTHRLRAELRRGGVVVLQRQVTVEIRESSLGVTIVMSRSCATRTCPGARDPVNATECVGDICVVPECTPETPEVCPSACEGGCPDEGECGGGVCLEGLACGVILDDSACPAGYECTDARTCRPRVTMPDGGERDGGEPGPDGGAPVDAPMSCVPADCLDGNPCTDDGCSPSGCTHVPNTAFCDDAIFCNGADRCGPGATCSVHDGDPCATELVCNEGLATCDCPSGLTACRLVCVDTRTSPSHCGACDSPCAAPHAVTACTAGRCIVVSCDSGYDDCNGLDSDGCEIDMSAFDCAACGIGCVASHVAVFACTTSFSCLVGVCDMGWSNCDLNHANGCETVGMCP